jgi:hypothetical protein
LYSFSRSIFRLTIKLVRSKVRIAHLDLAAALDENSANRLSNMFTFISHSEENCKERRNVSESGS